MLTYIIFNAKFNKKEHFVKINNKILTMFFLLMCEINAGI